MKNLWILTEERPKKEVLKKIIEKFCLDNNFKVAFSNLSIKPLMQGEKFCFTYQLTGLESKEISNVYIKTVSGSGSFVDFLVFFQEKEPVENEQPLYAIEETKTDDSESRNTGVYQRCSKFVYLNFFYPNCKKIMLYNLSIIQKEEPTQTNIFGTRMLLTLGVEILGKKLDPEVFKKFDNLDDLISFKKAMRKAPKGNVPISIIKTLNSISISGRLFKSGGLSHDPNIGALSLISQTIRNLGWDKEIKITLHGLSQKNLASKNKFVKIANKLGIKIDGLNLPPSDLSEKYWHYEKNSEKVGTIFVHLILEELKGIKSIYENHAGCERGYLYCPKGICIAIHKYVENQKKNGAIPKLPDLIILNEPEAKLYEFEGKTSENVSDGIAEIKLFGAIEKEYLKKYYPKYSVERGVILFGGEEKRITEKEVIFLMNSDGEIIVSAKTPKVILNALKNIN
ncbi:MAG: hypothetical protein WC533_04870 [Candidatus Pacearchaeota archaeon]